MMSLRSIHFAVGVAGVFMFLLSGQYMHAVHHHLQEMDPGPRMLFRSAHIYLLWSSLLNLLLGCYMVRRLERGLKQAQAFASIAILMGPVLLCLAFFYEPHLENFARPFARSAVYAAFLGSIVHGLISLRGIHAKRNS